MAWGSAKQKRNRGTIVVSMIGCLVATSAPTDAQQPRIRTLVYEPKQKEWVEQPPPPVGTAEGGLYAIKVQVHDGHYRKALSAIKQFERTETAAPRWAAAADHRAHSFGAL